MDERIKNMTEDEMVKLSEEELNMLADEEYAELSDEELENVSGGVIYFYQKAGIIAACKAAKLSGYTLDDMDYIFETARRAQEREGSLGNTTAEELEAFIRSVWPKI